jgi:hypothetical protein
LRFRAAAKAVALTPAALGHRIRQLEDELGVKLFERTNHDWFRLIYRRDDPRRSVYQSLANALVATPLR